MWGADSKYNYSKLRISCDEWGSAVRVPARAPARARVGAPAAALPGAVEKHTGSSLANCDCRCVRRPVRFPGSTARGPARRCSRGSLLAAARGSAALPRGREIRRRGPQGPLAPPIAGGRAEGRGAAGRRRELAHALEEPRRRGLGRGRPRGSRGLWRRRSRPPRRGARRGSRGLWRRRGRAGGRARPRRGGARRGGLRRVGRRAQVDKARASAGCGEGREDACHGARGCRLRVPAAHHVHTHSKALAPTVSTEPAATSDAQSYTEVGAAARVRLEYIVVVVADRDADDCDERDHPYRIPPPQEAHDQSIAAVPRAPAQERRQLLATKRTCGEGRRSNTRRASRSARSRSAMSILRRKTVAVANITTNTGHGHMMYACQSRAKVRCGDRPRSRARVCLGCGGALG
jgi:hypothetical protein